MNPEDPKTANPESEDTVTDSLEPLEFPEEPELNEELEGVSFSEASAATEIAAKTSKKTQSEDKEASIDQQEIEKLERQKWQLEADIRTLQEQKAELIAAQVSEVQELLTQMIREGVKELEQQKQALETSIEQLERRRERIQEEMRTTFAGASQELAVRIQGFKDYLVGSLQDLAASAEQLELPTLEDNIPPAAQPLVDSPPPTPTLNQGFGGQAGRIRQILEQYRTRPDYYGPPWQLRRTFEPIHAERVQNWLFSQGGRGAIRTMGSRLQNILIASAIIAVLHNLYGNDQRSLILANTPERLGEWRRGLQDCLGISRSDFGPDRGVVLFESPEALIQKADRLVEDELMPLVIIDETEDQINLSLLQFPLWLAFAPDPQQMSSYYY